MLQKARNEGSGHPHHRNRKRKAENQNYQMVARRPATARTLSSDMEKSAKVICQIAWASVFRGSPLAPTPATAPAASVASTGAAEKARSSRQIFQHTHNSRIPPASSRPTICRICVAKSASRTRKRRCSDNPDQYRLASLGMWQARGSKADDD
jgi:hypothetical protein